MASPRHESIDVLRKSVIIGFLVIGMIFLHRFAAPTGEFDPTGMLALGFVILASYTVGELVGVIKLPHITGYLFAGVLLGPSFAHLLPAQATWAPFDKGVLNETVIGQLDLFNTLALALIAITAGGELKIDGLRRGYRRILGVLGGQTIAIFLLVPIFFVSISGTIPGIGLEAFSGFGFAGSVAVGIVLAAISLATSPAATIAVINESQAKGEVTETTLATVVLKDVVVVILFSLTAAITVSLLGSESTTASDLAAELSWHILGSLVIGGAIGLAIAVYLSWVRHEVMLFLIGVIFTAAFASQKAHLDPALLFIAAGFAASNFSSKGDTLIHEVEKISTPVYVVFFTLAGAKLHLDTLAFMAPYAFGLVAVRMVALYLGVRSGGALVKASTSLQKYGWMGFVSQAGVALTLAELARSLPDPTLFPGAGDTFATLVIAGIAIHEILGPILLKIGLGLSQELPASDTKTDDPVLQAPPPSPEPEALTSETDFTEVTSIDSALNHPLETHSDPLNMLALEWGESLQGLVRDFLQGPLRNMVKEHERLLKEVRHEFLRYHRRLTVLFKEDPTQTSVALRAEQLLAAERWRQFVLRQEFEFRKMQWDPTPIVRGLDQLVDTLPDAISAPIEPISYTGDDDESSVWRLFRLGLRARRGLSFLLGEPTRQVDFKGLAKFYFSGQAPGKLESIAAIMVSNEAHLVSSTRSLFEQMMNETESILASIQDSDSPPTDALRQFRQRIEEEFNLSIDEVERASRDTAGRLSRTLGALQTALHEDLISLGTFDLPQWSRRYSRVFSERTRGLRLLEHNYPAARDQVRHGLQTLALELELLSFEGFSRAVLDQHAGPLTRRIQGKGQTQLQRVLEQLDTTIEHLDALLQEQNTPLELSDGIRSFTEPLHHVTQEATRNIESLLLELQDEGVLSPLLDALISGAAALSETYELPSTSVTQGNWHLPQVGPTTAVPFRRAMVSIMETTVSSTLLEQTRNAADRVQVILEATTEFERMVPFNRELAVGDLASLESQTVPIETRNLISDMLLGSLQRSRQRLVSISAEHADWSTTIFDALQVATLVELEGLREEITTGEVQTLGLRLKHEASGHSLFTRDGNGLSGLIESAVDLVRQTTSSIVGPHRLRHWQQQLGLEEPKPPAPLMAKDFQIDQPLDRIPRVYRRLFSDRALEAGDLLSGRQETFHTALSVLSQSNTQGHRSVALVGQQGVGKRAVVAALSRKFTKVHSLQCQGPCTEEDLQAWLKIDGKDILFLVPKLHWLISMTPDGSGPLQILLEHMIKDRGRNAFLLVGDTPNWTFATQTTSVQHLMGHIAHLEPLSVEHLTEALLTRHGMSGYTLTFPQPSRLPKFMARFFPRIDKRNHQREARWFEALHSASAGIMQDAMAQWLNAISGFENTTSQIHMGEHASNALNALTRLPDDLMLTLRQITRQGWMTPAIHSKLFRLSNAHSHAILAQLTHFGLVEEQEGVFTLTDRHAGGVYQTLRQRGWSP